MAVASANPDPTGGDPTVASIVDEFLGHAKRHYEGRSYDERRRVLERFVERHGFRRVADCCAVHLTRWLDEQEGWKSDWTLNTAVSTVKGPFDWAVQQGLILANPFKAVNHRPGQPRRPITDDEFRSLLRGAGGRRGKPFRQVLIFMRWTGCRPGELSRLRWRDIDVEGGRIILREHKTAKKTRRPRVIHLVPVTAKLLVHRRKASEGEFVFLNSQGRPWDRCSLRSACGVAGIARTCGPRRSSTASATGSERPRSSTAWT